jgi:hypothetical protein
MNQDNNNYFSKFIQTNNEILLKVIKSCEKNCTERTNKRIKDLLISIIKKEKDKIKIFCMEGLPDEVPILRSLIWKINLKYLNKDVDSWSNYLERKRSEYNDIKEAFMMKLEAERQLYEELNIINQTTTITTNLKTSRFEESKNNNESFIEEIDYDKEILKIDDDHLNKDLSESINRGKDLLNFIKYTDRNLLEEIDKDVRRTHSHISFFSMPTCKEASSEFINKKIEKRTSTISTPNINDIYINKKITKYEIHSDVISRILYIYAKLNQEIMYVQGMNEIIAPLYYCFSYDNIDKDNNAEVEADAFWSFSILMEDLKVLFKKSNDQIKGGIFNKLKLLDTILKLVDKDVHTHLNKQGAEFTHFSFRWFILLFSQEFMLPDVIRLWDIIFSENKKYYMVFYIALAVLKIKRKEILQNDFTGIILTLQNLLDIEMDTIINVIGKLKKDYGKKVDKLLQEL